MLKSPARPGLQFLLELEDRTAGATEREIMQAGIDIAQAATSSRIGYLHYLNEDPNSIELGTWSHDTLGYCTATHDRHYPLSTAGVWADSARKRAPCIHNDYASVEGKRGLPLGHSPVIRHLGLPVIDAGAVRLLIGVGNKDCDYDANDVAILDLLARRIWSLIRERRHLEVLRDLRRRLDHLQEVANLCGCEYDVDDDRFRFDAMFAVIFRTPTKQPPPLSLQQLLDWVDPADHARLREVVRPTGPNSPQIVSIDCRRSDGQAFHAQLKIEFRPREAGQGQIGIGILRDLTETLLVEELKRRAESDALTGLPNRHHLATRFASQGVDRLGEHGGWAFHFIDLDRFKPVNDSYGHATGDAVLVTVARRLRHAVRRDDVIARIGGDEFAIIQCRLKDRAAAEALASKIIVALSAPMQLKAHTICIGASIGIAISDGTSQGIEQLSKAADRALYRAKAAGGGGWSVATPADHQSTELAPDEFRSTAGEPSGSGPVTCSDGGLSPSGASSAQARDQHAPGAEGRAGSDGDDDAPGPAREVLDARDRLDTGAVDQFIDPVDRLRQRSHACRGAGVRHARRNAR